MWVSKVSWFVGHFVGWFGYLVGRFSCSDLVFRGDVEIFFKFFRMYEFLDRIELVGAMLGVQLVG